MPTLCNVVSTKWKLRTTGPKSSSCSRSTPPSSKAKDSFYVAKKVHALAELQANYQAKMPASMTNNTIWATGQAIRLAKGSLRKVMAPSPRGIIPSLPCHLIRFNRATPPLGKCILRQSTPRKKKHESSPCP